MAASRPVTLDEWLAHIERGHPQAIAMGLDRVRRVKDALALELTCPVITVGGTNGKGSACMMLEAILAHAGYDTGCYTSPHLLRYNERVRITREDVCDETLIRAFAAVEAARERVGVPLTYFEMGTLAAAWLFKEARVDVAILEVGLGGRLDAVNAFEPDCALVMSVAMDHMDYLGDTREKIAFEKAGIFRAGKPAIFGEVDAPRSLCEQAQAIGARLLLRGRDFDAVAAGMQWRYQGPGGARHVLPWPALRGAYQLGNAAVCITALDTLRDRLPITMNDLRTGLLTAENPGRFQVLPGQPLMILDVAHNPHAAQALAENLKGLPRGGSTFAVFAMLADKDITGVARMLCPQVTRWYAAGLAGARGITVDEVAARLRLAGATDIVAHATVAQALADAREAASTDDKIIVLGSFHTVAEALTALRRR
jgi:dihydrofolate synthase/folylpolyglutamate synthase